MVKVQERRQEIKAMIERDHGVHNLNFSELGRKYGVSHNTIREDIAKILSEVDKETVDNKILLLVMASEKALKSAMKVLDTAKDSQTRLKATKIISDITCKIMDRLDAMGFQQEKDKEDIEVRFFQFSKSVDLENFLNYCNVKGLSSVAKAYLEFCKEEENKKRVTEEIEGNTDEEEVPEYDILEEETD